MFRFVSFLALGPLLGVGLGACAVQIDDADEKAAQVYDRAWVAEELAGVPVVPGVDSSLLVAADGKVSGNAGCNSYFGSAIVSGEAMTFGNLGTTKMACQEPAMSQESRLLRALDGTRGYRVQDDALLLLDGAGTTLVRFRLGGNA